MRRSLLSIVLIISLLSQEKEHVLTAEQSIIKKAPLCTG